MKKFVILLFLSLLDNGFLWDKEFFKHFEIKLYSFIQITRQGKNIDIKENRATICPRKDKGILKSNNSLLPHFYKISHSNTSLILDLSNSHPSLNISPHNPSCRYSTPSPSSPAVICHHLFW